MRIIYHCLLVRITHRITHRVHSPFPLGQFTFDSFGFWKHEFVTCAYCIEMFDQIYMKCLPCLQPEVRIWLQLQNCPHWPNAATSQLLALRNLVSKIWYEHNFKSGEWHMQYFISGHQPQPFYTGCPYKVCQQVLFVLCGWVGAVIEIVPFNDCFQSTWVALIRFFHWEIGPSPTFA